MMVKSVEPGVARGVAGYLVFVVILTSCLAGQCHALRHGIVIDAGSSGSRARLYKWHPQHHTTHPLRIEEANSFSLKSGVDDHLGHGEDLHQYLTELMAGTRALLGEDLHASTPLYLMATGGVRALGEDAEKLMSHISRFLDNTTINPFLFSPSHVMVLSGEEEAYFAWLAANYLVGFFNTQEDEAASRTPDVGIVELGGSSVQVAFLPVDAASVEPMAHTTQRRQQPTVEVHAQSYQTFGSNAMIYKIREAVMLRNRTALTILDPCALKGDLSHVFTHDDPSGRQQYPVEGTGDVEDCLSIIHALVPPSMHCDHVDTSTCMPPNMTFYGLGAMKYSLKTIGVLNKDGSFSLRETMHKSKTYCRKSYTEVQAETGRSDPFISADCTVSMYLPVLLHKALGLELDSSNLLATNKINGQTAEWSIGAMMVYAETQRERHHRGYRIKDLQPQWVGREEEKEEEKEAKEENEYNTATSLSVSLTTLISYCAMIFLLHHT